MTLQDLIARLDGVKQRGQGQYSAHCPCRQNHTHDDKTNSFEFRQDTKTGKLLVFCQRGCSFDDICAALGCTPADLMPEPTEQERRQNFLEWWGKTQIPKLTVETVYSYAYGEYNDGLCKVRFRDPDGKKTFRWIHNDPTTKTGFKMNHDGCQNRLYIRGSRSNQVWFIVEGEKDADTLHRITTRDGKNGATVVSTENGASATGRGKKWLPEYTEQITGKTVYILWDNDEPGQNFARIERDAIIDHAAQVYMLDLTQIWNAPEKSDISDMVDDLGADETFSRLAQLIQETEPEAATVSPAMENQPEAEPEPEAPEAQQTTPELTPARQPATAINSIEKFIGLAQTSAFEPIPTGIREFDNLVNGGFIKQSLVTLGAAPGAGKTILAQQIFEAAAENANADILYFNLEMSEEQLIARSLSRATGLTQTEVIRGYAWTDDQRRKITTAANYYRAKIAPHIAYNPPDKDGNQGSAIYQNIIQIMEMEAALRDPAKPLITVIDYLQLLCDANGGDDVETIKKAMKAFKDFAINHNAVVFLVMAHSRAVNQDGNATQGAGRDTSAIEYSGDLQLSLNYGAIVDGTYNRLADMERAINDPANPADESLYNYRCLTVTKNRFGRDHVKCFLTFDGEQSRFDFTTKCRKYTPPKPNITPIRKKLY